MYKEVLEAVLKKSIRDSSIQKIIGVEDESAIQKGLKYSSKILRIKLKVVMGNGMIALKTLIIKKAKTGEIADQQEEDYDLFGCEALMYGDIFNEMGYLMEDSEDYEDPLWCEFIHYDRLNRTIVLEDLEASGFKVGKPQFGLDFEHAELVLRNLARYHAMSKRLDEQVIITEDGFLSNAVILDSEYANFIFHVGIKSLGKAIKKYWGPEWANIADKLAMPQKRFVNKMMSSTKIREGEFTCLNHGDCWANNIMFKYDWQDRPISLRFLDYQNPHYHSPCVDVTYFMYLGIQPAVRHQNYKLLLQCYHESLASSLKKYGYTGTIPTFEEIEKVMERFSFLGYGLILSVYLIITGGSKNPVNIDSIIKTKGKEGFSEEIYKEPGLIEKIGPDLKDFVKKHFVK